MRQEPDLGKLGPAPRRLRRSVRRVVGLVCFLLALLCCVSAVHDVVYAGGLAGEHGTGARQVWLSMGVFFLGFPMAGFGVMAWAMNLRFMFIGERWVPGTTDELFAVRWSARGTTTSRVAASLLVGGGGLATVCFVLAHSM
ncbi:hypothetical protein ACFZCY_10485 [Streptomyces sp. NPDC007983]|uniref:hypothetical protein n=1 Tax=Streptomyces sp. NPDC007983 TaxID=3364800 RepID=UPI0036E55D98